MADSGQGGGSFPRTLRPSPPLQPAPPPPQPSPGVADFFRKPIAALVRTLRDKTTREKRRRARSPSPSPAGRVRSTSPSSDDRVLSSTLSPDDGVRVAKRPRQHSPSPSPERRSPPSPPPPSTPDRRSRWGTAPLPQLSTPTEGLFRGFRRLLGVVTSGFYGAAALTSFWTSATASSRGKPLIELDDDVLHHIFSKLPAVDIIRSAFSCKALHRLLTSEAFRMTYRTKSNFKAPLLALFVHPYSSEVPVATLPGFPFDKMLLTLNLSPRRIGFIADSRDGRLLTFNCTTVQYQWFYLHNPTTRVVIDLPKPEVPSKLAYLAAGYIPKKDSFKFEVIVLYGSSLLGDRHVTTALYCSDTSSWTIRSHSVDFAVPCSPWRVKIPSILIGRVWNVLFMGEAVLGVDLTGGVSLSHIPVPLAHQGPGKRRSLESIIGKLDGQLCFIETKPEGINIWKCNGAKTFSDPEELFRGVQSPALLGFAEENSILIADPDPLSSEILLLNLETLDETVVPRNGQDLELFAYELESPPIQCYANIHAGRT